MARLALGIEYDGSGFLGWQRLGHGPSVQAAVEAALSFVAAEPVLVTCAGRTDSGVHARCQVVHFDTSVERAERSWMLGATSRLPPGVAMLWARRVDADFHARHRAFARRYRYLILDRPVRPALHAPFLAWEPGSLDAAAMQEAANALLGEHDFSAFRSIACQARTAHRTIHAIEVRRVGDLVAIEVEANAFLHHMVRNIVGSLLPVGRGAKPVGWLAQLLAGRDRALAGPTAPAAGLVFLGPRYPPAYGLDALIGLDAKPPEPVILARERR
jgi:tRNA pseudouridine38-40 synthase